MLQHPMVTVSWAINGLETAIRDLGDGPAEQRVRRQFHQLIVALEHDIQSGLLTPPSSLSAEEHVFYPSFRLPPPTVENIR